MPQLFGAITVEGKPTYSAMFCSDSDQSHIVTISWWLESQTSSRAATFEMKPQKNDEFILIPRVLYFTDDNGGIFAPKLNKEEYQKFSSLVVVFHRSDDNGFIGSWELPGEEKGQVLFFGAHPLLGEVALDPKICEDWGNFKKWADGLRLEHSECAFRGHGSNLWQLTTTINRAGRTRLERYYDETIQVFRTHAEVAMDRDFDLTNSVEYATLVGLAQHHGLPTPLLDITESPYVAAYFAFADAVENKRAPSEFVRVYAFSGDYLRSQSLHTVALAGARPYLSPLTVSPRHNPRLYAQQGRFIVTNIVNLEAYLLLLRRSSEKPILYAADIPVRCAFEALQDLKYMGLTAGTLFPGLDGVSKMIKQMMMVNDAKHQLELIAETSSRLADQTPSASNDVQGAIGMDNNIPSVDNEDGEAA